MSVKTVKVTDLIKSTNSFSYSVELTPDVDIEDLNQVNLKPLFYSITWHAKLHRCKDLNIPPLQLAEHLRNKGFDVLLHLSCDLLTMNYLNDLFNKLMEINVCNLFVVLGESFDSEASDFKNTNELITYIRQKTGEYFCIGIAGFPDHDHERIKLIKDKVDNGADFIITQAFFESAGFLRYVETCRQMDVKVPIIAGMYVFETIEQLINFVRLCRVKVSDSCLDLLKKKSNESNSEVVGRSHLKNLIEELEQAINEKVHYHFFTLNKLKRTFDFVIEINKN